MSQLRLTSDPPSRRSILLAALYVASSVGACSSAPGGTHPDEPVAVTHADETSATHDAATVVFSAETPTAEARVPEPTVVTQGPSTAPTLMPTASSAALSGDVAELAVSSILTLEDVSGIELPVTEIASSSCAGSLEGEDRAFRILYSAEALHDDLVKSYYSSSADALSHLDFDQFVVIAAHAGRGGCGPTIGVTRAVELQDSVQVEVTETFFCWSDASLSWSFAFATVPKVNKPYWLVSRRIEPAAGECASAFE